MSEYTTDVRELDNLYLATIGGADYYEVRQIVKQDNGIRSIVGRASDWPLIEARATCAELTHLLAALERARSEMDVSYVEQACKLSAYADELAGATAEIVSLKEQLAAADIKARPTEFVAEPREPQVEALVARLQAHTPVESPDVRRKCPYCTSRPMQSGMQAHIERAHPTEVAIVGVPTAPIALEMPEPPWRCESCHETTHARSLQQPSLCIRCVVAAVAHTNGHLAAA